MRGEIARRRMALRALALAREVRRAGFGVAGQHVAAAGRVGELRSPSLTRSRRKCMRSPTCASVRLALGAPLCSGWPFFRNGPSRLPYRSFSTTSDRTRFGTRLGATRLRAVAGDALRRIHGAAAIGGRAIDQRQIDRPGAESGCAAPTRRRDRWILRRGRPALAERAQAGAGHECGRAERDQTCGEPRSPLACSVPHHGCPPSGNPTSAYSAGACRWPCAAARRETRSRGDICSARHVRERTPGSPTPDPVSPRIRP